MIPHHSPPPSQSSFVFRFLDRMGRKAWPQNLLSFFDLRETFHTLTTTLLSLLLPLSFLLLARLSAAHYLLDFNSYPASHTPSPIFSLFLRATPINPLHLLVSIFSVAALVQALSGAEIILPDVPSSETALKRRLYAAWISLCSLQVCVGLGIEGTIGARFESSGFGQGRSFLSRIIFFVGLHETMLYWSRMVVKPVVEDTVFGFLREERGAERATMAVFYGGLWWWKLRDEVESLVVVAEVKREMGMGVGVADFMGWWLYYLTVTIGMVRVARSLMWAGMILLFRRAEAEGNSGESLGAEDKV